MDLEADDGLVLASLSARAALPSNPIACSSANAASSSRLSLNAGPASWKPTGRPSLSPHGIEIAGIPASDIGTVQKSFRYIASGSSVFAPSSNAVHGLVGVTMKSKCSKTVAEVLRDLRADLLRGPVIRVVVAARERVGAEHDPPLDLGAEAVRRASALYIASRSASPSTRRP